jgi:hypothetical protein
MFSRTVHRSSWTLSLFTVHKSSKMIAAWMFLRTCRRQLSSDDAVIIDDCCEEPACFLMNLMGGGGSKKVGEFGTFEGMFLVFWARNSAVACWLAMLR